eukprot:365224-Chlamydomonas_euryale.AAC.3
MPSPHVRLYTRAGAVPLTSPRPRALARAALVVAMPLIAAPAAALASGIDKLVYARELQRSRQRRCRCLAPSVVVHDSPCVRMRVTPCRARRRRTPWRALSMRSRMLDWASVVAMPRVRQPRGACTAGAAARHSERRHTGMQQQPRRLGPPPQRPLHCRRRSHVWGHRPDGRRGALRPRCGYSWSSSCGVRLLLAAAHVVRSTTHPRLARARRGWRGGAGRAELAAPRTNLTRRRSSDAPPFCLPFSLLLHLSKVGCRTLGGVSNAQRASPCGYGQMGCRKRRAPSAARFAVGARGGACLGGAQWRGVWRPSEVDTSSFLESCRSRRRGATLRASAGGSITRSLCSSTDLSRAAGATAAAAAAVRRLERIDRACGATMQIWPTVPPAAVRIANLGFVPHTLTPRRPCRLWRLRGASAGRGRVHMQPRARCPSATPRP